MEEHNAYVYIANKADEPPGAKPEDRRYLRCSDRLTRFMPIVPNSLCPLSVHEDYIYKMERYV